MYKDVSREIPELTFIINVNFPFELCGSEMQH